MITCYDPELDRFTDDLVGDFDYLSAADRESWFVRQWTEIAAAMGWAEALDQTLNGLRRSRMGFADLGTAALGAFQQHVDRQREGDTKLDRARVRALVLDHFATTTPRNLWRIDTSVARLPEGACFNLAKWHARPLSAGQDTQLQAQTRSAQSDLNVIILPHRAFLADAGPSYFADAAPEGVGIPSNGRCGWQTPLRLCLGTFPWVYGHRLQSPAPGPRLEEQRQLTTLPTAPSSSPPTSGGPRATSNRTRATSPRSGNTGAAPPPAPSRTYATAPSASTSSSSASPRATNTPTASTAPAASSAPPPSTTSSAASPPSSR
jgi:hypothetical protein